jgi:alcohol dehydrogenase class IV
MLSGTKWILNYNEVEPNPTIEFAESELQRAKEASPSAIVSIGGGSTIDVGKYLAFNLKIPHTAIPTTAGTGSEVTKYAVFIENGRKKTIEDERLIPDSYFLESSRVTGAPTKLIASCGLDALSQGIESYWSRLATGQSRHYSKMAFRFASKNLLDFYRNPSSEVLGQKMLQAANYSGKAINIAKTSICHAISYSLTIHYGIPHGQACAYTLPFFVNYYGFRMNGNRIRNLILALGMGMSQEIDVNLVANEAIQEKRAHNVPGKMTLDLIKKALWESAASFTSR